MWDKNLVKHVNLAAACATVCDLDSFPDLSNPSLLPTSQCCAHTGGNGIIACNLITTLLLECGGV